MRNDNWKAFGGFLLLLCFVSALISALGMIWTHDPIYSKILFTAVCVFLAIILFAIWTR